MIIDVVVNEALLPPVEQATIGFFGVGPETARDTKNVFSASLFAVEEFGETLLLAGEGLLRFFTPGSLGNFVSDTFSDDVEVTTAVDIGAERDAGCARYPQSG